jgi:prevent-host-death family protein
MERELNARQARTKFSTILDQVQHKGDAYIINRNGKPAVAVVPLKVYENWKSQREALFVSIRAIQELNQDSDPDEAMELILEAQQAIRAERKATGVEQKAL